MPHTRTFDILSSQGTVTRDVKAPSADEAALELHRRLRPFLTLGERYRYVVLDRGTGGRTASTIVSRIEEHQERASNVTPAEVKRLK